MHEQVCKRALLPIHAASCGWFSSWTHHNGWASRRDRRAHACSCGPGPPASRSTNCTIPCDLRSSGNVEDGTAARYNVPQTQREPYQRSACTFNSLTTHRDHAQGHMIPSASSSRLLPHTALLYPHSNLTKPLSIWTYPGTNLQGISPSKSLIPSGVNCSGR
jgi:hypothetical protein